MVGRHGYLTVMSRSEFSVNH